MGARAAEAGSGVLPDELHRRRLVPVHPKIHARRRSPQRVEVAAHPDFPDVVFFVAGTGSVASAAEVVAFDETGGELARAEVLTLEAGVGSSSEGG